jgi:hypothetical protein
MAPARLLAAAPKMPVIFACRACSDSGLIAIAGIPQADKYEDLFSANVPCVCAAGDFWRPEFAVRANPPKCRCGRVAVHCLLTAPVCEDCWPEMFAEFRATRDPGLVRRNWGGE